jgi:hypothetical protein
MCPHVNQNLPKFHAPYKSLASLLSRFYLSSRTVTKEDAVKSHLVRKKNGTTGLRFMGHKRISFVYRRVRTEQRQMSNSKVSAAPGPQTNKQTQVSPENCLFICSQHRCSIQSTMGYGEIKPVCVSL